ncbi:MAG: PBSX family phage terminase large subunit [Eubacteriales bacterium]
MKTAYKSKKIKKETEKELVSWWKSWCDTNVPVFRDLLFNQSRYLVLMGGGGSGKSVFAGRKLLERCATEKGHRVLVVRKTEKSISLSCFSQLKEQAETYYPDKIKRMTSSPMRIVLQNGSEIVFSGLDNVEKLKSIRGITMIWIEEASEITEYDFNQLDIRLRDETPYYKQIILTFNPVSVTHWLKARFYDKQDRRATTSRSNYKDNPFLPDEAIQTLEAFRETDEYYYTVYCLGEWGVTGKTVFPAVIVSERLQKIPNPVKAGYFAYREGSDCIYDITWIEDERNQLIYIYKEPDANVPFVIGGDIAGNGSDRFVGQVLNNKTKEQCAVLKMTTGEKEYCNQMYCLGKYYNTALIGIEINFSTYPVNELARLGYPKLYVRQSIDRYTHKTVDQYGFLTDKLTRNTIIARLINHVKANDDTINDRTTLEEMLTFVRNEEFRPEAQEGAHDDCIMALAIALAIEGQQKSVYKEPEKAKTAWTDDMWDDYNAANSDTKRYLKEKWGTPKT